MRLGAAWDTRDAFRREYHLAAKFMSHPDFVAGVSARLLHKPATKPQWQPSTLDAVSAEDVESFFKIEEGEEGLELLTQGRDYDRYPFERDLGLPREEHVEEEVVKRGKGKGKGKGARRNEVLEAMVEGKEGQIGVREKVEEVLERRCEVDEEGNV
ncbi:MAG: hypothetical protein Q9177_006715, partial [Variospora cf. flavescens]